MKRNILIGIVVLVTLSAAGAKAQDYIFTNFLFGHQDHVLSASPCATRGGIKTSDAFVYDKSAWIHYLCEDGAEVNRRFFHPTDNVIPPVDTTPVLLPAPPLPPMQIPASGYCQTINMYPAVGGGCVDWNHPNRAGR